MNRGVIVCGYQGIGKSTLADSNLHYIDLESGNFWIGGKRSADWYITYVTIAINLASQGRVVFLSSHKEVRDYLNSVPLPIGIQSMCCVPSETLKLDWIQKLHDRYLNSGLDKDFKAWRNAEDRYIENIQEIKHDFEIVAEIVSMNYNLYDVLQRAFTEHNFGMYT